MKVVQSTWTRFWHFDLARELHQRGCLEHIFTTLPWWRANKESIRQNIPPEMISCNFLMEGFRHVARKFPILPESFDGKLSVQATKSYSNWVAKNLPECDVYIGISGSGLSAGRVAKSRGSGYIMDRGSAHIRYVENVLQEEHDRWKMKYSPINPWLIENEIKESEEATFINVPSEFAKRTFIAEGVHEGKLRVIPYGVSVDEFAPMQVKRDDVFRLLFVGQFNLRKGAPYLLEAFRKFKHPKKELLIVGSVSEDMRPIISRFGEQDIKFLGVVPRLKVKEYMAISDALVLPSIEDGFGLVLIQAAACGLPTIASTNTGFDTIFTNEKHGLLVKPRDVDNLIETFNRLSEDSDLRLAMGQACMERVKDIGGWREYAEGVVSVCHEAKANAMN